MHKDDITSSSVKTWATCFCMPLFSLDVYMNQHEDTLGSKWGWSPGFIGLHIRLLYGIKQQNIVVTPLVVNILLSE